MALMQVINRQFTETPVYGVQQMTWHPLNEAVHRFGPPEIGKPIRVRNSRPSSGPTG